MKTLKLALLSLVVLGYSGFFYSTLPALPQFEKVESGVYSERDKCIDKIMTAYANQEKSRDPYGIANSTLLHCFPVDMSNMSREEKFKKVAELNEKYLNWLIEEGSSVSQALYALTKERQNEIEANVS